MNESPDTHPAGLGRRLETYARRYARNRTLPWLVIAVWTMLTIACFCGGFALASYGYSDGPFWLAGLGVVLAGIFAKCHFDKHITNLPPQSSGVRERSSQ